ncbi:cytokine-dependent hematopoietic cell linker-like isoform X3 [Myxocyprinus asiaticus]|nr:cytokine-dependent hematopoietic cell linker-like isoform X3 [Myxocyprinus asiaticus]
MHIPPRPPRSVLPGCKAPSINRNLKPGRLPKSYSDGKFDFVGSTDKDFKAPQRPVRSLPRDQLNLPPLPGQTSTDQLNQVDQFNVSPPSRPAPVSPQIRTNKSNTNTWPESSLIGRENVRNRQSSTSQSSQRFSLDLDSQDLDSDCERERSSSDSHLKIQQHHEWPPAKGDTNHSSYTNHSKPAQQECLLQGQLSPQKMNFYTKIGLEEQNWYVGTVSRVEAEHALHLVNQEGAFLVRDCSKNTTYEPFVLAVFYDKRVFNIQIRFSEETSKYTLGTGLRTNDRFDSVTDIIKFHSIFPIILIDGRKTSRAAATERRQCVLMYPITKQDIIQLLN